MEPNLPQLPSDIQKVLGRYIVKEIPAYCRITEGKNEQQGFVYYNIIRNSKIKFTYTVSDTMFRQMQLEGVKQFLTYKTGGMFYVKNARGTSIFSIYVNFLDDDLIYSTYTPGLSTPATRFPHKHYQAAFKVFVRDLVIRSRAAKKVEAEEQGRPYEEEKTDSEED